VVQARLYLVDDRLFIVYHAGAKKNSLLPDVKKYLSSLKVDGMVELPTPVPAVANTVATPEGWQEFTAQKDGFSVSLPGKPKREVTSSDKTMETVSYLAQSGLDGYGVFLLNFKDPALTKMRPGPLFDMAKESLLKEMKGVIGSEKNIQLGPYAGYEFLINHPKSKDQPVGGQTLVRMYLAGTRLYMVAAIITGKDTPPEVTPFLDSFKVLEPK
jgi:hypothetical protein